ncbi:MAG: tetratricopeptide repeat protein [Candidatus Moranbacteria bacterium]|nr:tetratricopeptide repeat protein [Candidatus Moranbacteria bacterium]
MSYLYFILPPIIIVSSLALIIFIISKKSLEIEKRISEGERKAPDNKLLVGVKAKSLNLLEKITHLFKVFALKFHNWNENKLRALRKKKNEVDIAREKFSKEEESKRITIPVSRKIDIQVDKKEQDEMMSKKRERKRRFFGIGGAMISGKVVHPDSVKKGLEEALIERIASDPRDIEAYERLGDYYMSRNNLTDAQECYKQVLKLNPQSLSVRNKLSRINR